MALRMYHYTGQEGIVCRFSIRPPLIVAYKTLVVSRDLKLIKDSHPKNVISMDRLYLTELLGLQGVRGKTCET